MIGIVRRKFFCFVQPRHNPDDSSDEDIESESPLDEYQKPIFSKSIYLGGPPTTLSIRERRQRRDSVSRSDTSGSSAGDLGDITPCNASPHLPGMISFRPPPIRDESEEIWRRNLQSLLIDQPTNHAPDLLFQLYKLIKVDHSRDCLSKIFPTKNFFLVKIHRILLRNPFPFQKNR